MQCRNCGRELNDNLKFCIYCGEKVQVENAGNSTRKSAARCSACGAELVPGMKFCTDCGTKIPENRPVIPVELENDKKQQNFESGGGADTGENTVASKILRCASCGAELEPGTKFCTECGARISDKILENDGSSARESGTRCSACGAELIPGTKFCTECGTRVPEKLLEIELDSTSTEENGTDAEQAPDMGQNAVTESARCSACGAELIPGMKFCTACGTKILEVSPVIPVEIADEEEQQDSTSTGGQSAGVAASVIGLRCASCGAELEPGTKFCTECGTRVPEKPLEIKLDSTPAEENEAEIETGSEQAPDMGNDTGPEPARCSACGAELIPGMKFCTACGTKIPEISPVIPVELEHEEKQQDFETGGETDTGENTGASNIILRCVSCGAELEPGTKFCTECGTRVPERTLEIKLDSTPAEENEAEIETDTEQAPDMGNDTGPEPARCSACGAELISGMKFCTECGTRVPERTLEIKLDSTPVEENEAEIETGAEQASDMGEDTGPEPARCSACGAELIPGMKFCTACGTKIPEISLVIPVELEHEEKKQDSETGGEADTGAVVAEPLPAEPEQPRCPSCGRKLMMGYRFCMNCSARIPAPPAGAAAAASAFLRITCVENPEVSYAVPIWDTVTIGRKRTDLVIQQDPEISPAHCRFRLSQGTLFLSDAGSETGTFYQGQQLQPDQEVVFMSGSAVCIGQFSWSVELAGNG